MHTTNRLFEIWTFQKANKLDQFGCEQNTVEPNPGAPNHLVLRQRLVLGMMHLICLTVVAVVVYQYIFLTKLLPVAAIGYSWYLKYIHRSKVPFSEPEILYMLVIYCLINYN